MRNNLAAVPDTDDDRRDGFFRGAFPGEVPNFAPKEGATPKSWEYELDENGFVVRDKGVSLFDNRESVIGTGRVPYEVDLNSVPAALTIQQQGRRPDHYAIIPSPGFFLTPNQYKEELGKIRVK